MLFDLFLKFVLTPENVLGLIWSTVTTICMCLIFCAWQEKWWKSLIPFYGNYLIYKHTWKKFKWLFLVEIGFDTLAAKSTSFMKKHIVNNVFYTVKTYIETRQLDIEISPEQLFICMVLLLVSAVIVFVLKRVTYMKICTSLNITNTLLKIGTFLLPEVFLLVDYIYYKRKEDLWI